jgi:O-antigen ligase
MKFIGNKTFFIVLSGLLSLEMVSWLSYANTSYNKFFFGAILIVALLLSFYKLEWGIYIVLAELFIGSKGYLLAWPIGDYVISLRLGLFLVVFLAFLVDILRKKKIYFFSHRLKYYYSALIIILFSAMLIGYFKGNIVSNIFFDANGYLFFGLVFPIAQAFTKKEKFLEIISVLFAAAALLIIKTFLLLFIFSQDNFFGIILIAVYKWVRDTGVGEITQMSNGFSRIFLQSQIYSIICFFIGLSILSLVEFKKIAKPSKKIILIITALSLIIVFISYSRSFWLGMALIFILFFSGLLIIWRLKFKKIMLILGMIFLVGLIDYALMLGMINLPLPGNNSVSAVSLVSERTKDPTSEAAGSSRMELLNPLLKKSLESPIIGSGFGTTVTYKTKDPRALAANPDGNYTTYAFEWGYLDLWLKLGAIGLIVYLLLLYKIISLSWRDFHHRKDDEKVLIFGALLSLGAIIVIHFFTPYLNHPLGICWLLIVGQIYLFKE